MRTKMIALLMACTLLAGCADAIPDPEDVYSEDESIKKAWVKLNGNFTLTSTDNNTTLLYAPTITIETNTTYGLIEISDFNYSAIHLSFEVINNTVKFNNYTFNMKGYLVQNGVYMQDGLAPDFGDVDLHFAAFPFDVTVEYEVVYRVWDGRE